MGMVSKIMENDALREMISSMANSAKADDRVTVDDYREKDESDARSEQGEPSKEASAGESTQGMPDLSSLLNPEMLNMLPGLLGALGQNPAHGKESDTGDHRALLLALRPFLSENRRRAVDMMIGMEKLGLIREILPKER